METLHRLHLTDPAPFYALPPPWQARHLAHTRNHIQGRYLPGKSAKTAPRPTARMLRVAEEWRVSRQRPPSAAEVAGARKVLRFPGLPASLEQAARQTLLRAGLEA
jgi:hypothetical protein